MRGGEVKVSCRCGASLSGPDKGFNTGWLVERFLVEHSRCHATPLPPLPKVVKPPATKARGI